MKLSKAQKRVLGVMIEPGCRAYLSTSGLTRHAYLLPDYNQKVRPITLQKLEDMELIEDIFPNQPVRLGIYYYITDAGREWVRQSRLA